MTVLVVDDAVFMRYRLRTLMEQHGHIVVEATHGKEAIALYAQVSPDVVLMNIVMPEWDGLRATRAIRTIDPDARVVIVSALGNQATVLAALQAGAKEFIPKPFRHDQLIAAVCRWGKGTPGLRV